jgi:hypothetical protein
MGWKFGAGVIFWSFDMKNKTLKNKVLEKNLGEDTPSTLAEERLKKGRMSKPLEAAFEAVEKMNKKDVH